MESKLLKITPDSIAKMGEEMRKHVRRLALQHGAVLYYRENGILMEEKPGKYKKVLANLSHS